MRDDRRFPDASLSVSSKCVNRVKTLGRRVIRHPFLTAGILLLVGFAALNILAYMHAYSMTHDDGRILRIAGPKRIVLFPGVATSRASRRARTSGRRQSSSSWKARDCVGPAIFGLTFCPVTRKVIPPDSGEVRQGRRIQDNCIPSFSRRFSSAAVSIRWLGKWNRRSLNFRGPLSSNGFARSEHLTYAGTGVDESEVNVELLR